jgi:hypothetical protein
VRLRVQSSGFRKSEGEKMRRSEIRKEKIGKRKACGRWRTGNFVPSRLEARAFALSLKRADFALVA